MTQSYTDIYVHLVWQTRERRRILVDELESFVHERTTEMAEVRDLSVLAFNSAWNHVHGLLRWHPSTSVADAVRAMKSKVTVEWNRALRDGERTGEPRRRQSGYGAISVRRSDVGNVCSYTDCQKRRHRREELWTLFESVSE